MGDFDMRIPRVVESGTVLTGGTVVGACLGAVSSSEHAARTRRRESTALAHEAHGHPDATTPRGTP
jgi:hypothetical protein